MYRILIIGAVCLLAHFATAGTVYKEICGLTIEEVNVLSGPVHIPAIDDQSPAGKVLNKHYSLADQGTRQTNKLFPKNAEGMVVSSAYSKLSFAQLADAKASTQPVFCVAIAEGGLAWGVGAGNDSLQYANAVILSRFMSAQ